MMLPTKIHAWFVQYGIDPMIGWEVVECATDDLNEIEDEAQLLDHCHTYIIAMLEPVVDEPTYVQLGYLQNHLVPLIRSLAPYFDHRRRSAIFAASVDADTEFISTAVRVAMYVP